MPSYKLAKRPGFPNWYIVWTEGHRSHRRSTGTADRRQAELVLAAFILEINRPAEAEPDEVGLVALLQEYYDDYASHLPSSVQADIAVRHLTAFYGASTVAAVTLSSQDKYIAKRRKEGVADETISRELSVLRAALRRAEKHGKLKAAPFVKALPKAPARERWLTRKEAAKLLKACREPHLRMFVRLALYTGARSGAILDLTWDRVDFAHRKVWYPLPQRRETNKRRAVVPIVGAMLGALRRAKRNHKGKYVVSYQGQPVASVKKAFRAAVKRAGLKGVTPHTLRHTAATWAAQNGVAMFKVSGILGQRMLATTERYTKHSADHLVDAAWAIVRAKSAPNDEMDENEGEA
ncbi:MAG TPA: tyrosine-type recombinase/integrase [Gemmatimonadales bacterium]